MCKGILYFLEQKLPSNTSRSLDKNTMNRSQSHIEDKFPLVFECQIPVMM